MFRNFFSFAILCASVVFGVASAQASDTKRPMYAWEQNIKETPVLDYSYNTRDGEPYYSDIFEKSFDRIPTEYSAK